jgi:hypothetical protein
MKQEQNILFVEIREPQGTRRDILMATKDVLDALKRYEEYKSVQADKSQAIGQLRRVIDELQSLNRKLRSKMPKLPVKLPTELTFSPREREGKIFTGPEPSSAARPKSKLDVLQEELAKIEERLSGLE